ncbi:MAG: aminotransferase class V-fold PLP-dependent enzyme [Chlamydiales bacterium]|nr:aminotransferase class V-fold PLP-dependent enzyme [Chlamydiales bacterium]
MSERIYLDHATASPAAANAVAASLPYFEEGFGLLSVPYVPVQEAKKTICELFGAGSDDQFVFTSSGAEACSIAIHSAYQNLTKLGGKNHFVARAIDEAPTVLSIANLEDEGCYLKLAPISKRGFVTPDGLIDALSPRTAVVSMSWACGLTGVIQPLEEIAAICKERSIWLHVDATHVVGKLNIAFNELPIDILTFSGHGLHAPVGTGGLFAKKHIPLRLNVFANPLNMPMLAALQESSRLSIDTQSLYCTEVARLRDMFEETICQIYPEAQVLFKDEERVPNITTIAFGGISNELLAFILHRKGIFANMGGGAFQPIQKVIEATGADSQIANTALSFSIWRDTQEHELERASQLIGEAAKRLRRLSKAVIT